MAGLALIDDLGFSVLWHDGGSDFVLVVHEIST